MNNSDIDKFKVLHEVITLQSQEGEDKETKTVILSRNWSEDMIEDKPYEFALLNSTRKGSSTSLPSKSSFSDTSHNSAEES
jgi:hypothetical protein